MGRPKNRLKQSRFAASVSAVIRKKHETDTKVLSGTAAQKKTKKAPSKVKDKVVKFFDPLRSTVLKLARTAKEVEATRKKNILGKWSENLKDANSAKAELRAPKGSNVLGY